MAMSYVNKRREFERPDKHMALQHYLSKINERERLMEKSAFALLKKLEEMDQRASLLSIRFEKLGVLKEQYFQMAKNQLLQGSTYEMLPSKMSSQLIAKSTQPEYFSVDTLDSSLHNRISFDKDPRATLYQESTVHDYMRANSALNGALNNKNTNFFETRPDYKAIWTQTESIFLCNHCSTPVNKEIISTTQHNVEETAIDNDSLLIAQSPKKPPRAITSFNSSVQKDYSNSVIIENQPHPMTTNQQLAKVKIHNNNYKRDVFEDQNINNVATTASYPGSTQPLSNISPIRNKPELVGKSSNLKAGDLEFDSNDKKNGVYFSHSTPNEGASLVSLISRSGLPHDTLEEEEYLYNSNGKLLQSVEESHTTVYASSLTSHQKEEFGLANENTLVPQPMPNKASDGSCNDKECSLLEEAKSVQQEFGFLENERRISQNSVLNMSESLHSCDQMVDDMQVSGPSKGTTNIPESPAKGMLQKSVKYTKNEVNERRTNSKVNYSSSASSYNYKKEVESEEKHKTRSKKVTGGRTPSFHSEDSSAPTDSEDSFFSRNVPLTSTAAYQSLLGAVPIPQASRQLSDSESEDEIENALAKAVIESPHRISEQSVKPELSSAEIKTSKDFRSSGSHPAEITRKASLIPSSSASRNKLSKTARKALGMDSDSDVSPPGTSVKKSTAKEDSDEFDFYD